VPNTTQWYSLFIAATVVDLRWPRHRLPTSTTWTTCSIWDISGASGAKRRDTTTVLHPKRARWTRRCRVVLFVNSALTDVHTGSNERTNVTNKRTKVNTVSRRDRRTATWSRRVGSGGVVSVRAASNSLVARMAEATLIRARRSRIRACMYLFLSFLVVLFLSNYRRNQQPLDESRSSWRAWITSLARRRRWRSLVEGREGRGATPTISAAEDISSRNCRSATTSERYRSRWSRRKRDALIGGTTLEPSG